jgi:serine protease SohB
LTEFLTDYGLFLLKTVTVLVALLVLLASIAANAARQRRSVAGSIRVTLINEQFADMKWALQEHLLPVDELKALEKSERKRHKEREKKGVSKRVFVLGFDGDIRANGVESLRHEITAILSVATKDDEVVISLESPGGQVHMYGLAASQLERIRGAGIPLTVCVDKVAASGGYMMACVANRIVAAPFAVLGSIGVVAELPNFNRALKRFDVEYDVFTAGQFKRTVSMLAENTEEGIRKFREELDETHELFKALVQRHRPSLAMDQVATGEHWYGSTALERGLIDQLGTSDDYLFALSSDADLLEVKYETRKSLAERIGLSAEGSIGRIIEGVFERLALRRTH